MPRSKLTRRLERLEQFSGIDAIKAEDLRALSDKELTKLILGPGRPYRELTDEELEIVAQGGKLS